jgi:hypothetical protein
MFMYVSPAKTSSCCRYTAKKLQERNLETNHYAPHAAPRAYRKMYVHMQGPQGPPYPALQIESG